jgi:hypothetical protein
VGAAAASVICAAISAPSISLCLTRGLAVAGASLRDLAPGTEFSFSEDGLDFFIGSSTYLSQRTRALCILCIEFAVMIFFAAMFAQRFLLLRNLHPTLVPKVF